MTVTAEGWTFVLKRFLIVLCMVVFHALLGAWPKADAQGAPVQYGSVFNSEGPGPSTGPSAVIQGNDNPPNGSAAGAIQAIAADPSRLGTIYAGAGNGGIWKTTDGGTNWVPLIDQKASLSIASLAFDPTDSTHQTPVAGTGVTSNGAFASTSLSGTPANYGGLQNGLLYSRNGGTTWTQLGAATLSGESVVGVAALGTTILAATFEPRVSTTFTGGLYRSIDSGATFEAVSGVPGPGLPAGPVSSLVGNPNPNILYAALMANSIKNLAATAVYVYQGQLGRDRYDSNGVAGGVSLSF